MYKLLFERILRGVMVVALIIVAYYIIQFSFLYIYPFLLSFLLAAWLNPSVSYLQNRWKIPRGFATIIVILTIFLLVIGLIILLITEIVQGSNYLAERIPVYFDSFVKVAELILVEHILPLYETLTSYFQALDTSHQATILENFKQFLETISSSVRNFIQSLVFRIPSIVGFFPGALTTMIFILLATFMMTNDWDYITKRLKRFVPETVLFYFDDFRKGIKQGFSGYVKAQLILIFITAFIILVGLLILGINHALTIALISAIVDLLPFIGTGIIFVPWIVYAFITANYSLTIGITCLYMTVIIVRQLIEPKIISANIGINPLVSLMILFISLQLWGIIGVIFAPFILISCYVLFRSGILLKILQFIKG
ncbi:sporulation integral membrane protein YtvI [Ornithinibacillus contaminans]|uniref:sporulation integral membrane protein YtvI n=1 Tax=Ornithinibacillus contaminans TaxID=694055 RepID=UPI00064DF984|nr:sporulation integral membrane protein YtvI [Ornithinibacillus contaminans]